MAIIGSRNIVEYDLKTILRHIPKNVVAIISGGATGVDTLAENLAFENGLSFTKIDRKSVV